LIIKFQTKSEPRDSAKVYLGLTSLFLIGYIS